MGCYILLMLLQNKHGFLKKISGSVLEEMIREDLPSDIRSREGVMMWIEENW